MTLETLLTTLLGIIYIDTCVLCIYVYTSWGGGLHKILHIRRPAPTVTYFINAEFCACASSCFLNHQHVFSDFMFRWLFRLVVICHIKHPSWQFTIWFALENLKHFWNMARSRRCPSMGCVQMIGKLATHSAQFRRVLMGEGIVVNLMELLGVAGAAC